MRKKATSMKKKISKTLLQLLSIVIGVILIVKGGKLAILHIVGLGGFILLCIGLFMLILGPLLISNSVDKTKGS